MDHQKKNPICEVCGKNEALYFSFSPTSDDKREGEWKMTCNCKPENELHSYVIETFFNIDDDMLTHVTKKEFMKNEKTSASFSKMMKRYIESVDQ